MNKILIILSAFIVLHLHAQKNPYDYPDTLWIHGTSKDETYGLIPEDAIKVGGGVLPKNIYTYLKCLTDSNGNQITYTRIGSCGSDKINRSKPLTCFRINMYNKDVTIYFDQYEWEKPMILKNLKWKENRLGYKGEMKNDTTFHGKGIYFFNDGGYYKGDFQDGIMHGYGTMYIPGIENYTGNFINGKYDGYGKLEYPDGGWYEGKWKNGEKSGRGKIYYPRGNVIEYIEGEFENDKPIGKFKVFNTDGSTSKHEF